MIIQQHIQDLFHLFYPRICAACAAALNRQEHVICAICEIQLPYTNFHLHDENPLSKKFWGRLELSNINSLLYFEKGSKTQQLLHLLKYHGRQDIGVRLAEIVYQKCLDGNTTRKYDAILSIPLHPKKLKTRGYNQNSSFAIELARLWEIPYYAEAIQRKKETVTQTGKSRIDRWANVESIFRLSDVNHLRNKQVLLIDDVLTTGATLEACGSELLRIEGVQLSILTMACKV